MLVNDTISKEDLLGVSATSIPADVTQKNCQRITRVVLRFYKPVPVLVGPDKKRYGPFFAEDVGSVPLALAEQIVLEGYGAFIDISPAK